MSSIIRSTFLRAVTTGTLIVAAAAVAAPTASATQWIEANNVRLRYELTGNGPRTIVLLHEMRMTMETWD